MEGTLTPERRLELRCAGVVDLQGLDDMQPIGLSAAQDLALQACVRVAAIDDRPAGFVVIVPTDYDNAEIHALFVAPAYRRTGIGRRLLNDADALWGAQGIDRFEVNAVGPMVAFYERVGFVSDDVARTCAGESVRMHRDLPDARPLPA
ncbi:MAG TPA: GNAT family N-acetyltransferase [Acidimicrobiia bacterium]|jgi:GNAT superfamily N-acetyltransferase